MYAHAQQRDHGKHHDLARERQHNVYHTHDDLLHHTAEVASHNAEQRTQPDRAYHGQQGEAERRTDAVNHTREHTTSQLIRAERVLQAVIGEFVENIRIIRIVRRDHRRQQADQADQQHDTHRDHRRLIV